MPPRAAMPDLVPGTVLEQYEIEAVLGRGGFGVVYRARHRTVGDAFAVKAMGGFGASEALVRALVGEYRAQKRIKDKRYILEAEAPVSAVHQNVDWVLLPMEVAEKSLREWLEEVDREEEGWLEEGLELLGQVCEGVEAIHEAGLVHLDLKPENVLLVREGKGKEAKWGAKVADFGLARGLSELEQARPELFGDGVGTAAYMAPEQVLAAHWQDVGAAADIYALGMLLYELLQGRLPYSGSADRIKEKKRDEKLRIRRPEGPARLVELAMRCLSREEGARPGSAAEVARLLKEDPEEATAWGNLRAVDPKESFGAFQGGFSAHDALEMFMRDFGGKAVERRWAEEGRRTEEGAPRGEADGRLSEQAYLNRIIAGAQFEFVRIRAGKFRMGSDSEFAGFAQRPSHLVEIREDFMLSTAPVTQRQWEAVMGNNPSRFMGNPDHPVEMVSWEDAQEFIAKLNTLVPKGGFRLPTEAEWEYACRAGTTGEYGGTGELADMGWYGDSAAVLCDGEGSTHQVKRKKPNHWGLYDMHGNVWEWCHDWFDDEWYSRSSEPDPIGPSSGMERVLRGGCFRSISTAATSVSRGRAEPSQRGEDIGFRLAGTL